MYTKILFFGIALFLLHAPLLGQNKRVNTKDFEQIIGQWKGKLMYLDYQTNKPYEMPANVEISQIGHSTQFKCFNTYPNESSANSIDTLRVDDNGLKINAEEVKSKKKLRNGVLEIVTEIEGKDGNDNKPALMRHTYLLGKKIFEIKKEVMFTGTTHWILRHTYSYARK